MVLKPFIIQQLNFAIFGHFLSVPRAWMTFFVDTLTCLMLDRVTVSQEQRRTHTHAIKKKLWRCAPLVFSSAKKQMRSGANQVDSVYRWCHYGPFTVPLWAPGWPPLIAASLAGPSAAPTESAAGRRWRDVSDPHDLGGETGVRTKSERTACPLIGIGGPIVFEKQRHSPLRFLSASSAIALWCGMSWAMSGPMK